MVKLKILVLALLFSTLGLANSNEIVGVGDTSISYMSVADANKIFFSIERDGRLVLEGETIGNLDRSVIGFIRVVSFVGIIGLVDDRGLLIQVREDGGILLRGKMIAGSIKLRNRLIVAGLERQR